MTKLTTTIRSAIQANNFDAAFKTALRGMNFGPLADMVNIALQAECIDATVTRTGIEAFVSNQTFYGIPDGEDMVDVITSATVHAINAETLAKTARLQATIIK
jgi:hypothetical protein